VPGRPVNDQQLRVYMHDRRHHSQRTAAARAGFSERTGRRIEAGRRLPPEERPRRGRTVPDPLAEVWERELLPILDNDPAVQAVCKGRSESPQKCRGKIPQFGFR